MNRVNDTGGGGGEPGPEEKEAHLSICPALTNLTSPCLCINQPTTTENRLIVSPTTGEPMEELYIPNQVSSNVCVREGERECVCTCHARTSCVPPSLRRSPARVLNCLCLILA